MKITRRSIDEVFDSIDIACYERRLPELQKKGSSYVCKSPFGKESTPSFHVWKQGTMFKDFSSGKGGNFITLLMELDGLTYPEALQWVADFKGITLEKEGKQPTQEELEETASLTTTIEKSIEAYQKHLHNLPYEHPAWQYLHNHLQLDDRSIQYWGIGFAPETWHFLWDILREQGLYKYGSTIGLLRNGKDEKVYDALRGRIVFPIHNERGQYISFGGRTLDTNFKDNKIEKWINGQSYELYDKSTVLYGIHAARGAIRMHRNVYLVEGYTDVISMHRAGAENTVATCGTALSDAQCTALKRITPRVTILRDSDPAGEKAALRDFEILIKNGLEALVCMLPDGMDPDEFVRAHMTPRIHHSEIKKEPLMAAAL